MKLKALAKINLSLDVIGKRPDGYHNVKMIMQTIDLHDNIHLEAVGEDIQVMCSSPEVPSGSNNIAYKAACLLKDRYGINAGLKITIDKKIPIAAGLAGGSTDAAAVLKGMNVLFSLGLTESELMSYGKEIGADVPYCIKGGTMLAEGIGDILTELSPLPVVHLVLVKPKISVSTPWVYKSLDMGKVTERPDTGLLISAIENCRIDTLAKNMKNVLETVTAQEYEIIGQLKDMLKKYGALGSMMSGSGPTVFGVFPDHQSAEKAYKALKSDKWNCFLTYTTQCEER